MEPHELYDATHMKLVEGITNLDLTSDSASTYLKNLRIFSDCAPQRPDPATEPEPVPTTWYGKAGRKVACALESETTRTILKVGGPVLTTGMVIFATIKRDHILERQALDMATKQRF